jgi:hypothetical protein
MSSFEWEQGGSSLCPPPPPIRLMSTFALVFSSPEAGVLKKPARVKLTKVWFGLSRLARSVYTKHDEIPRVSLLSLAEGDKLTQFSD